MKLLGLLITHASSYLSGRCSNSSGFIGNAVSRHDFSILKAGGSVQSGISINISDPIELNNKSVYDDTDGYIKRLELENGKLMSELCDQQKLIQDLTTDIKLIDKTSRACMIFELYQRLRTNLSNDLEERGVLRNGKKLEAFLEDLRKGKAVSEDKIVYWMMKFETTPEVHALKKFRNDHSHQTIDDITILRQWRTDLLRDSSSKNREINSASIAILNKVIGHLSAPRSKPLQSKYHTASKVKVKGAKVIKQISKKELRIETKALKKKLNRNK